MCAPGYLSVIEPDPSLFQADFQSDRYGAQIQTDKHVQKDRHNYL